MSTAWVDPRVLSALATELEDPAAALSIARLYRANLERRVARLHTACSLEDVAMAMDVVLSIKVTSATVGALAIRTCAERVEPPLAAADWAAARAAADAVRAATPATLGAMDTLLGSARGTTEPVVAQTEPGSSIR